MSAAPGRPGVRFITSTTSRIVRAARDDRELLALAHDLAHLHQLAPERAGRVEERVVLAAEAALLRARPSRARRRARACADVLAVGARFSGQASSTRPMSSTQSARRASVDSGSPVIATIGAPILRAGPSRASISADSPEFESASRRSRARMRPRSPCSASVGCRTSDGVPGRGQRGRDLLRHEPGLADAGHDDEALAGEHALDECVACRRWRRLVLLEK